MSDMISTSDLAALLGVTKRRVQQLAKDGTIPKVAHGKYHLAVAVGAYCKFLRDSALSRTGDTELKVEKLRLTKAQADKAHLEVEKRRGELVVIKDVEQAWASIAIELRSAMLAIPSRVASRAALPNDTVAIIDSEIRVALESVE